jgi:hypothetical protein
LIDCRELDVIEVSSAKTTFGLTEDELRTSQIVTSILGEYLPFQRQEKKRVDFLNRAAAADIALTKFRDQTKNTYTAKKLDCSLGAYFARFRHEAKNLEWSSYYRPPFLEKLAYLSCTPCPYLNATTHRLESGIRCLGCKFDWHEGLREEKGAIEAKIALHTARKALTEGNFERDRVFSEDDFLTHFDSCVAAQRLWMGIFARDGTMEAIFDDLDWSFVFS